MKVLIIFSGNTISGAEIILQNYLRNFDNKNIEFFAICSNRKIKEFLMNSKVPEKNITVSPFFSQLGITKSAPIVKEILKIIKIIFVFIGKIVSQLVCETKKIDVVYGKNTFDILFFPFLKGKRKFVLHIHDILKNDITSKYIQKLIHKKVDKVIAVSNAVKESLTYKAQSKTVVIYNGIEITFSPSPEYPKEQKLVWVGSIEERKNPQEFIEIVSSLNKKGHNIIGVIIYKYFQENVLENITKMISKTPYITIKHNLPREKVLEEIKNSIALVITSIEDPLPTVILESYSLGIPVISPNRSGMKEMVIHKKTGILYENPNEITQEWNEIIKFFIQSRKEIIDNIQNLLTEKFSINKFIENINKILLGEEDEENINSGV